MIADIGYANVFQQAGIFGENYNNFDTIVSNDVLCHVPFVTVQRNFSSITKLINTCN